MLALKYFIKGFITLALIGIFFTVSFLIFTKIPLFAMITILVILLSGMIGGYLWLKDSIK